MEYLVAAGLIGILSAVIFFDLRHMRIPNTLSFLSLALFVLLAFTLSPGEIGIRIAQAVAIFAVGFFAFMFHLIGGGDVKVLATLALFIPPQHIAGLMLVFSATLFVGIFMVLICRHFMGSKQSGWAFLETAKLPMGLPIGLAGILAISTSVLN